MVEFKFKNPHTGKNESVHVSEPYRFRRFKVVGKKMAEEMTTKLLALREQQGD